MDTGPVGVVIVVEEDYSSRGDDSFGQSKIAERVFCSVPAIHAYQSETGATRVVQNIRVINGKAIRRNGFHAAGGVGKLVDVVLEGCPIAAAATVDVQVLVFEYVNPQDHRFCRCKPLKTEQEFPVVHPNFQRPAIYGKPSLDGMHYQYNRPYLGIDPAVDSGSRFIDVSSKRGDSFHIERIPN